MMSNDPAVFVDGVPVKISERFRPPRKITLASSCFYQVNTESLTDEYDFTVENESLKWLTERKKFKSNLHLQRQTRITIYEEKLKEAKEKLRKLKEEEAIKNECRNIVENKTNEEDNERNVEKSNDSEEKNDECNEECNRIDDEIMKKEEKNITLSTLEQDIKDSDNNKFVCHDRISETIAERSTPQKFCPTVLIPTPCSPNIYSGNSSENTNININFADFEGDASDPFDSVALKSINDMEELAKVLQTSHIENSTSRDQNNPLSQSCNTSTSLYSPYTKNLCSEISSENPIYYPYQKVILNSNVPYIDKPAQTNYEQHWDNSILSPPINGSSSNQYTFNLNNSSNLSMTTNSINTNTVLDPIPSLAKRQDLEDFYSRYYSNQKIINVSNARSGQSTPTANMFSSLRSSNSVPDLTAVEDPEVVHFDSSIQRNRVSPKVSFSNPSSRPSSTLGIENLHQASNDHEVSKIRLPDPFTELTSDAQALVQNMTEMGFPRSRVARAIQKLGTDHKKLLEVLLVLQSFQDSGEDEYRAERALYFYMGEIPKVKEFLAASKVLLNLGFKEEIVIDHLFRHQNNKEKCLEELIS